MSKAKLFLCTRLECHLFNQVAVFSIAGLSISTVLASICDLQIPAPWF